MIYGYWNPVPVMAFAVAVSLLLLGMFWLLQRSSRSNARTSRLRAVGFYSWCRTVFATLTPPLARSFWGGVSSVTLMIADRTRALYTGDGQTYNLYVLYYFVVLYVACGGLGQLRFAG